MLLPTCLVGSYPQPDWLIDRDKLSKQVPRVRMHDLWRIDAKHLEAAQDDATLLAIRDQERAGLDIVSDGEQRRESYSNRFATALDGVDIENPGTTVNRSGKTIPVPRITGRIRRRHPVETRDVELLRANTDRKIKATVPGALYHGPAGAGRLLSRRGSARDGLRRRAQCRDQGPVRRRRRHRAGRRALDAAAS
jgi:5-methyltetrahydropteroyltriglutamate--homocysteine methyltransferase